MDGLVGYTGFVGGNLVQQHAFTGLFNTGNIDRLGAQEYDTLVISAVPATMWLANQNPEADRANILNLFEKLRHVRAARVVLISTIAVYRDAAQAGNEDSNDFETDLPYGRHRREFEMLISDRFTDHFVLRLPALFGQGLKKNFLFDLMNPVPSFLKPAAFEHLKTVAETSDLPLIEQAFTWDPAAGMWQYNRAEFTGRPVGDRLKNICTGAGITALAFTHADSLFQFYNLSRLWCDIRLAIENDLTTLNLATQPLRAGDIHQALTGAEMPYRDAPLIRQDMRSRFSDKWARDDGYLIGGEAILSGIQHLTGLHR